MNDKKTTLIHAAIKLFGMRDYHTTSVQDIVNLAGVSKGAFYQHFHSKDELLLSIFNHYFERLRTELQEAQSDRLSTPRELLIKGIELHCQLILENQNFLCMMVKGTAFTEKAISEVMARESLEIIRWFQGRIIELYGSDIEAHSMDCASMLNGCLKEYFFFFIFCDCPIDGAKLSVYLVDRLDDLVQGILRKQPAPILQPSLCQIDPALQTDQREMEANIDQIRTWIQTRVPSGRTADTMLQTLHTIVSEIKKEQSNEIIIQGMYTYLLTLAKDDSGLVKLLESAFAARMTHDVI
jgi:AcrR family transcriptional regulator